MDRICPLSRSIKPPARYLIPRRARPVSYSQRWLRRLTTPALALVVLALGGSSQALAQQDVSPNGIGDPNLVRDPFGPMSAPDRYTFFPPPSPVYGAAPAGSATGRMLGGWRRNPPVKAPENLSPYVNEFFYPALGTRLSHDSLSGTLQKRLDEYRQRRDTLADELRNKIVSLQPEDVPTRERHLREFAQTQTAKIVALESDAESLRHDMVTGKGMFSVNADWNQGREWKLGSLKIGPGSARLAQIAEVQVLRATAYFQDGLSVEQRALALELWMELRRKIPGAGAGRPPQVATGTEDDPLVIFFSPAPARVLLPQNLTSELRDKVGKYSGELDALKRELRETIVAQDQAEPSDRTKALYALATRQVPRLAALENLAEEIRHGMAALPPPPPPAPPVKLPPATEAHLAKFLADRRALEREHMQYVQNEMAKLNAAHRGPDMAKITFHDDFRERNADRYAALEEENKALFAEMTVAARGMTDPQTGKPMDAMTLLQQVVASDQRFDKIAREETLYSDYKAAMFEPGLSPEQRRLLYGRGLVNLAQGLPDGVPMPEGERLLPIY